MRERKSIILLFFLFQICKGLISPRKSFNQKLMSSEDFRLDMYVLESKYESVIQIPSDRMRYYQVEAGILGKYEVSQGTSVTVNEYGTIVPRNRTVYCYGLWCLDNLIEGEAPDRTEIKFFTGGAVVTVTEGKNSYNISIYVRDYGQEYSHIIFNSFVEKDVKNKENDLEKFKTIVEYAAQYPYEAGNGNFVDFIVLKKSDDWGSCNTINFLCGLSGIRCSTRYSSNDPDGFNGHLNIASLIDGKVYIANVGYNSSNNVNRSWYIEQRNIGFSYISSENGIIIYQYDGYDGEVNVPSTIDEKTVVGFKYKCFKNGLQYNGNKITKITLPNTITSLGDETFKDLPNLSEINIPIKVQEINMDNFIGCDNLTYINVDEDNAEYCSIEGILFNKEKTIIYKCPINNQIANFSSPTSLKRIEDYSFHKAKNVEIVNLKKNVTNIGKYAFANSTVKEIYFYGEMPEFEENSLLNLNVTIYYPANSKTWNIDNFDQLGAIEIRFVPWNPIEDKEEEESKEEEGKKKENESGEKDVKKKSFFKENKALIIIIVIGIVILLVGIIIFVVIRKRGAKTSDEVESIKGGLLKENMELTN